MSGSANKNWPPIPSDIMELFENAQPAKEAIKKLLASKLDLSHDAEFVSDFLKMQFSGDIQSAMEAQGVTKAVLAKRLGKTRQYVSRILNETTNYTIKTIAEIACALDMGDYISIRMSSDINEPILQSGRMIGEVISDEFSTPHVVSMNFGVGMSEWTTFTSKGPLEEIA